MNRRQLDAMKKSIKSEYESKIKRLRDEMQDALASLAKVEETFFASELIQTELPVPAGKIEKHLEENEEKKTERIPSVRARINNALASMEGEFTTQQLLEAVNNDGTNKEVPKNSFLPEFSRLKKDKAIIVVSDQQGNKPGGYKKAEPLQDNRDIL
jgi:hypothetical protein